MDRFLWPAICWVQELEVKNLRLIFLNGQSAAGRAYQREGCDRFMDKTSYKIAVVGIATPFSHLS